MVSTQKLIEIPALRTERSKTFALPNGRRRLVCHCKPAHYRNGRGWDDIALDFEQQSSKFLSHRNKVSCGFRTDGKAHKYFGLRLDYEHQLEATLHSILLDNKEHLPHSLPSPTRPTPSEIRHDLGTIQIINRINEVRLIDLVEVTTPITNFEITEAIHLKGLCCTNEQHDSHYMPDKYGRFNFAREDTGELAFWINPPWFSDTESNRYHSIQHALKEIDGQLIYTKWPTPRGRDDLILASFPILIDTNIYYSSTSDGHAESPFNQTTWAGARDGETGNAVDATEHEAHDTCQAKVWNDGKDDYYYIHRGFFFFDTSNLPDAATVTTAVLKLYQYKMGDQGDDSDVCAMKGIQADPLTVADYDAFTGSEYGHVTWDQAGYNSITFNAQGRGNIDLTGITKICIREFTHDYENAAPDADYCNGCYFAEEEGTDKDPRLEIDYSVGIPGGMMRLGVGGP